MPAKFLTLIGLIESVGVPDWQGNQQDLLPCRRAAAGSASYGSGRPSDQAVLPSSPCILPHNNSTIIQAAIRATFLIQMNTDFKLDGFVQLVGFTEIVFSDSANVLIDRADSESWGS